MTTTLLFSGNTAGAVADPAISPQITEEVSSVLELVEVPATQVIEETDAQQDWPHSYNFWKAAIAKIDAAKANNRT